MLLIIQHYVFTHARLLFFGILACLAVGCQTLELPTLNINRPMVVGDQVSIGNENFKTVDNHVPFQAAITTGAMSVSLPSPYGYAGWGSHGGEHYGGGVGTTNVATSYQKDAVEEQARSLLAYHPNSCIKDLEIKVDATVLNFILMVKQEVAIDLNGKLVNIEKQARQP